MKRIAQVLSLLPLLACLGAVPCQAKNLDAPGQAKKQDAFKHVVIIFQENRTPDNLFQGLCHPPFGGAHSCSTTPTKHQYNISTTGWLNKNSPTGVTNPVPVPLGVNYDLGHAYANFIKMYDGGKMDGAAGTGCTPAANCPTTPQFQYVDYSTGTLDPYLELATEYGWANYMFQTNQGPSFPAHQFIFGGTSAPNTPDDAIGVYAAGNGSGTVAGTAKGRMGCIAPAGGYVQVVTPGEAVPLTQKIYPCFEHPTLSDLLESHSVSWRYYTPGQGSIWSAPDAIQHICQPGPKGEQCRGADWTANVDLNPADVLNDISDCKLTQVSWVIPTAKNSDHMGAVTTVGGPSWVAAIVNAIGNDKTCEDGKGYWSDTAIIITWDDWGGWYDHERPPILDGVQGDYQYGFRVPFIVVSAFTPRHYINNVRPHDFGTVLRFIQHTFGLPEGSLGFADARANGDLRDFFRFDKGQRHFKTIKAAIDANTLRNDTSPLEGPDND